jgi:hypothetical protein
MDGNGVAATGDEEQNKAHGAVWEDSFAPFSEGFEATGKLGEDMAGGLGTGAADGALARDATGLAVGSAGGLGRGVAIVLAGGATGLARGASGQGRAATAAQGLGLARGVVVRLASGATVSRGRGLASLGRLAPAHSSGVAGHGSGAAGLSSGPAGLGNEGDGLGSGMIGRFETDPSIGDAFLASQGSATSGAQRRRRAAQSKGSEMMRYNSMSLPCS